ncbi:MAG: cytochrome d ubiquinol oxidase subunit II, partial [Psittacicella sp.]
MLNYEFLRFIWWFLLGFLMLGFAVTDGFDNGVLIAMPFLGKNNTERRVLLNTVGPVWEGNQTWLITAAGAMFAAWPVVYSVSFSGFYVIMILGLAALFFRPVGFEYRHKIHSAKWVRTWDFLLMFGGFMPMFG